MTNNGPAQVPTCGGGGADRDLLSRVETMEQKIENIERSVGKIKETHASLEGVVPQKGWYRIAEYQGLQYANKPTNGCDLIIRGAAYGTNVFQYLHVEFSATETKGDFLKRSNTWNALVFSKIRNTCDYSKKISYVEVYCENDNSAIQTVMLAGKSFNGCWKLIIPQKTEETVSGVSILKQMEIDEN